MITIVQKRDLTGRAQSKPLRDVVLEDIGKSHLFADQSNVVAATDGQFFKVLKGYRHRQNIIISPSEFYSMIGEEIAEPTLFERIS